MEQTLLSDIQIGVVGGSGIYAMDGFTHIEEHRISTPFGSPSDAYMVGRLNGIKVAFLPRHGRKHDCLPSDVNYRANIFGFKTLGITHLVGITAVGSLREHIAPLDIVVPDQLVDRTRQRPSTFFGGGIVAHVPFADPFCPVLSDLVYTSAAGLGANVHKGGTLVSIEGPAFSTRAESNLYRQWGIDIIGMTTLQEAKLAREAEICYSAMAMVTDYDCWRKDGETVSVEAVVATFTRNIATAKAIVQDLVPKITLKRECSCSHSLSGAIMTKPEDISEETRQRVWPIIEKYAKR